MSTQAKYRADRLAKVAERTALLSGAADLYASDEMSDEDALSGIVARNRGMRDAADTYRTNDDAPSGAFTRAERTALILAAFQESGS